MNDHPKHFATWTRSLLYIVMEKSITLGQQLITWSVVGNAGAMVISFNAVIQGSPCAKLIQSSATSFATGLCLAFLSAVATYVGYLLNIIFLNKINVIAERIYVTDAHARETDAQSKGRVEDFQESTEAWGAVAAASGELGRLRPRFAWIAPAVALILLSSSLIAFAYGIFGPLGRSTQELASCSARAGKS